MERVRRGGEIAYQDRADIEDLLARYATYWEFRACRAWAALFTEDGRYFDVQGRAALEAACCAPREGVDAGRDSIHAQTNTLLVQVADDRIHGLTNVVFGSHRAGEPKSASFVGYGDYHDVFVRTAEGWRFASRRACSHLVDPLPPEFL
ncbi:MAG TPA: nuclear transport factor 2 family protein [Myxococcota bacterium]|nr:nuclear transport factor 2 family protein [Myxococcota bacterium]